MNTSAGRSTEARSLPHAFRTYNPRIRWHDFVRNTEVADRTNLPCVQDIIAKRRNSLFSHVARLDDHTPAHRALSQVAAARTGSHFGPGWRRRPGRPRHLWIPAHRRRYTLQHSCRMVQGSSSWPLWVDATLLSTRPDDDDDDEDGCCRLEGRHYGPMPRAAKSLAPPLRPCPQPVCQWHLPPPPAGKKNSHPRPTVCISTRKIRPRSVHKILELN